MVFKKTSAEVHTSQRANFWTGLTLRAPPYSAGGVLGRALFESWE